MAKLIKISDDTAYEMTTEEFSKYVSAYQRLAQIERLRRRLEEMLKMVSIFCNKLRVAMQILDDEKELPEWRDINGN